LVRSNQHQLSLQMEHHGGGMGEGVPSSLHLVGNATPLLSRFGSTQMQPARDSPGHETDFSRSPDLRRPDANPIPTDAYLPPTDAHPLPSDLYSLPRACTSAAAAARARPLPVLASAVPRSDERPANRCPPWYATSAPAVCLGSVGAATGFEVGQACGSGARLGQGVISEMHPAPGPCSGLAHPRAPAIPFGGGRASAGAPSGVPNRMCDFPSTQREAGGGLAVPPPVSATPLCYTLCAGGTLCAAGAAVGLLPSAAAGLPPRPSTPSVAAYSAAPELTVARTSSTIYFGGALALVSFSEAC
jgi:hypothetical protein